MAALALSTRRVLLSVVLDAEATAAGALLGIWESPLTPPLKVSSIVTWQSHLHNKWGLVAGRRSPWTVGTEDVY